MRTRLWSGLDSERSRFCITSRSLAPWQVLNFYRSGLDLERSRFCVTSRSLAPWQVPDLKAESGLVFKAYLLLFSAVCFSERTTTEIEIFALTFHVMVV